MGNTLAVPDWTSGHHGLAEALHEAWRLSGRDDPFNHDMTTWRGFALILMAVLETRPQTPLPRQFLAGGEPVGGPT